MSDQKDSRPKVDFTGADFPSDTILRTSAALIAEGRHLEARGYRRACLGAWMRWDYSRSQGRDSEADTQKAIILDETARLVKAK